MKNILLITLGTRDVQLRKDSAFFQEVKLGEKSQKFFIGSSDGREVRVKVYEDETFPDILFLASPRNDGSLIRHNYDIFASHLLFPIIQPALDYLELKGEGYDSIFLVFTDQPESTREANRGKDTLNFARIIEKLIEQYYRQRNRILPLIYDIAVKEKVTDMDAMYDFFSEKLLKNHLIDEDDSMQNNQMYFLPQGGIDQINTALMLKLIEYYPNVVQFQKPEGKEQVLVQRFPQKFIQNMNRLKIMELLQKFHFSSINETLTTNKEVLALARLGDALLSLNLTRVNQVFTEMQRKLFRKEKPACFDTIAEYLNEKDSINHQKLIYLSAKVKLLQEYYEDYLWRMNTLFENLLKPLIENSLGKKIPFERKPYYAFNHILKQSTLSPDFLKKITKEGCISPGVYTYTKIYNQLFINTPQSKSPVVEFLRVNLAKLVDLRNDIIHQGRGVSLDTINQAFGRKDFNNGILTAKVDAYLKITDYDVIGAIADNIRLRL